MKEKKNFNLVVYVNEFFDVNVHNKFDIDNASTDTLVGIIRNKLGRNLC